MSTILLQPTLNFQEQRPKITCLPQGLDFSAFPWPGLLRCLYWSYRLDLPSLRELILQRIEEKAIEGEP